MAYDIYGNHLRRGYCEVHPDVPEEYPCYVCMEESYDEDAYREYYNKCMAFDYMHLLYHGIPASAVHHRIDRWEWKALEDV